MAVHFLASPKDRALLEEEALTAIASAYSTYIPSNEIYVEFSCVEKSEIQSVNAEQRNLDEPTDVLSFPLYEKEELTHIPDQNEPILLGSIMICPEITVYYKQSLAQVLHHGMLHLLGYDHETNLAEWSKKESQILTDLAKRGLHIQPLGNAEI